MTKSRKNWNKIVPNSPVHALQLCKEFAVDKHQMSIERIADRMGTTRESLYKYISNGTMHASMLIAFEQACGKAYMTQYSAHSQGFLLVEAPSGKRAKTKDVIELQALMVQVAGLILRAFDGTADIGETVALIKKLMEDLAYQERNLTSFESPQMALVSNED